ncbi:MAG: SH3 domain-containing protein [Candidatus Electrothrix sp. AUS4]|nr:SH3 domain-containing protein [Candidatus Electrothrix sp. AUS4]
MFATLPLGYAAFMLANDLYYYNSGSFYRPAPGGYMIVDAPVGAVVPSLPFGYSYLIVDGTRYYTYEGSYYLQVPNGYQIVPDPRSTVMQPQPVLSNQVVVTSSRLNVRSGPGIQYSVSAMVYSGDVLQVLQREAGWIYVRLPDNTWGWVMSQFTAPVGVRADG